MNDIQFLLDYVNSITGAGGVLLAVSAALFGLVKVYKSAIIQRVIGALPWGWKTKLLWDNWPKWVRWLVVFVVGFGGGLVAALAGGASVGAAIAAGVVAALTAMGANSTEKHVAGGVKAKVVSALMKPAMRDSALKTKMPKAPVIDEDHKK